MKIPFFQIDAFTEQRFSGNPAGVCLLRQELEDSVLQQIAAENFLPETAFLLKKGESYQIRWFTPTVEIDLCGHATLAAAHALFTHTAYRSDKIEFSSTSGLLSVRREDGIIYLDFPSRPPEACRPEPDLKKILGARPVEVYRSRDLLVVFSDEREIRQLEPDMDAIRRLDCLGVIVSAPGTAVDFVSRFFAPAVGIPEDPVTGSTHTTLIPYWSQRLGKKELSARQLSQRGGRLLCRDKGNRVEIGGSALTYLQGTIEV